MGKVGIDGFFTVTLVRLLALEIMKSCSKPINNNVTQLAKSSKEIRIACKDEYVERRFQTILDYLHK